MTTGQLLFYSGVGLLALTVILAIVFAVKKVKYTPSNTSLSSDPAQTQSLRSGYPTDPLTIRREFPKTDAVSAAMPISQETVPISQGTVPLTQDTVLLSEAATPPIQENTVLLAQQANTPPAEGTVPLAQQGTALLTEGTAPLDTQT